MIQTFMFNGNYCKATFDVTNILDDGTITDLKIEYSTLVIVSLILPICGGIVGYKMI